MASGFSHKKSLKPNEVGRSIRILERHVFLSLKLCTRHVHVRTSQLSRLFFGALRFDGGHDHLQRVTSHIKTCSKLIFFSIHTWRLSFATVRAIVAFIFILMFYCSRFHILSFSSDALFIFRWLISFLI